jgi:probable F420-dependent oxidoreductase
MRVGIVSPIVVQAPGICSPWELDAGVAELRTIAQAADELGFHHLTCSEHVGVPESSAGERGGVYWDPAVTLSFLASCTQSIRLTTQVVVLGYHHPLELVKRYSTLDRVSGGRLVLGVGVGTLQEEFDLLGAPFEDRGARADDALRALRAAWGVRVPGYHGSFYDFAGFVVEPLPVQQRLPIWVGGKSRVSLQRAVLLGDGWVPFGLAPAEIAKLLKEMDLPPRFDVVLSAGRPLDPLAESERVGHVLRRLRAAGATIAGAHLRATSAAHYCDQLVALKQLSEEVE